MRIYTIGFTKKSAKKFFEILKASDIAQIVDVRLNNTSQLAGLAKRDDLEYFLEGLCGIDYHHFKFLAPRKTSETATIKKGWDRYIDEYTHILEKRKVPDILDRSFFETGACLLCSESSADHCHRRLLAEYLKKHWKGVEVVHL